MKDKEKLIEHIQKVIKEPYKSALVEEVKPSMRLKTTGNPCPEIGKTKLGGCPDLPANITWPKSKYDDLPISFLGQINLAEISVFEQFEQLPKGGILYFFFNVESADDGAVIYSKEKELTRISFPPEFYPPEKSFFQRIFTGKNREKKLKESAVEMFIEYYFPFCSWHSLQLDRIEKITSTKIKPIDAIGEDDDSYIYEDGEDDITSNHHVLGHYQGIQNEYYELGFLEKGFEDPENVKLADIAKALRWKLLFQLDYDKNLDFNWADSGRIFFFIHEDDLKKGNFTNVKVTADCY